MSATYTFDVFSSLDGFGAHSGDWGGYWGKQGPEFLDRRLAVYDQEQRMVFGATRIGRTRGCSRVSQRDGGRGHRNSAPARDAES